MSGECLPAPRNPAPYITSAICPPRGKPAQMLVVRPADTSSADPVVRGAELCINQHPTPYSPVVICPPGGHLNTDCCPPRGIVFTSGDLSAPRNSVVSSLSLSSKVLPRTRERTGKRRAHLTCVLSPLEGSAPVGNPKRDPLARLASAG